MSLLPLLHRSCISGLCATLGLSWSLLAATASAQTTAAQAAPQQTTAPKSETPKSKATDSPVAEGRKASTGNNPGRAGNQPAGPVRKSATPPAPPAPQESSPSQFGRVPPEVAESAAELVEGSYDTFRRGLMPLRDHLDQLDIAWQAERKAAANGAELHAVDLRQIERLERALETLEKFNQPASENWVTELFLIRAIHAQTRSLVLTGEGRDDEAADEHERAVRMASVHLAQRESEGSGVIIPGIVINGVLQPAVIETANVERSPVDAEEFLSNPMMLSHTWALRTAESGRADPRLLDAYVNGWRNLQASLDEESPEAAEHFAAADDAAQQLFSRQVEFYRRGSTSLYDTVRTLRLRDSLFDQVESHELTVSPDRAAQRRESLESLTELAENARDRRGRIASDIATIQLMSAVDRALVESAAKKPAQKR